MLKAQLASVRLLFQLPQPSIWKTIQIAALFSVQVAVCIIVLESGYRRTHYEGSIWAVVSAILALQPGFQQSVVTSVLRIMANTIGAGVALMIGWTPGLGPPEARLIIAIVIVVFTCELVRLELALRTACVAVVIVLTVGGPTHVLSSGEERFFATVIGCGVAMFVQLATDLIRERVLGSKPPVALTRS